MPDCFLPDDGVVDLSPVEIWGMELDGEKFCFDPPVVLVPRLDGDGQRHFVADVPEFGLTVGGRTRDELLRDWEDQIWFVWREYVLADVDDLAADALELRGCLLRRVLRDGPWGS